MRRTLIVALALWPTYLFAAPHPEVTVIPIGVAQVPKGVSQPTYILPGGPDGALPQALVIAASGPRKMVETPAVLAPGQAAEKEQLVPTTVKFTVGGSELPPWELQSFTTAYVINLAALRSNPAFSRGHLEFKIELITEVEGMAMPMFGMPDPLLLDDTTSGPLLDFVSKTRDPDVKAYFQALAADFASRKEIRADWQVAREAYRRLTGSSNEQVARLARRGLRKTTYDLRPHNPSGNLNERYRWGLYMQQCGLFAPAFTEFDQCRIIDPTHSDSCFRAAMLIERMNGGIIKTMDYIERAAEAANYRDPSTWYSLVLIERKRGDRELTNDELRSIKINWILVQADVWGTTEGRLKIVNSFHEIRDTDGRRYVEYAPGLVAPEESIIEQRGWFDSVISVRPRLPEDAGKPSMSVGGDRGPRGAALTSIYHDAQWPEYYKAWFDHFTWAIRSGEQFEGLPGGDMIRLCGQQPLFSEAAGCRTALRYHLSDAEYERPRVCDEPRPGEAIHLWRLEGPFDVPAARPGGSATRNLDQQLTPSGDVRTILIDSQHDFINLKRIFGKSGPALARATCWVFSPDDLTARMWIGQNDGVAVWVNDRRIHAGEVFAQGKYEDRNIPDMLAGWAPLRRGWNELTAVIEGLPAPQDKGWGFSLRLCTRENEPILGMAYLNEAPADGLVPAYKKPAAGTYYEWQDVKEDFRERLPRLTTDDLRQITGLPDLTLTHAFDRQGGVVALGVSGSKVSSPYRAVPGGWQADKDRDVRLNNVLDWMREATAAIRYEKTGAAHDLMLLKPEVIDAYLMLLDEPPAAQERFDNLPVSGRVLGYLLLENNGSQLMLFAVDALLAETAEWPADEEDLLEPISPVFIPNKPKAAPLVGPPAP